jgi:hypothetical protein
MQVLFEIMRAIVTFFLGLLMLLQHSDLIKCSMRLRIEILHFMFERVTVELYVDFTNYCIILSDAATNVTQARGPAAVMAHEVDLAHCRVPIGYAFVGIVIEWKTCHIYKTVLRTI